MGLFSRKKRTTEQKPKPTQPGAVCLQGNEAYDKGDYDAAFDFYRKAAQEGDPSGMNRLGDCYLQGRGVAEDISKALYWYEKAAEQGHVDSQRETARIYAGTWDLSLKNEKREAYWFQKAAEQGDALSQFGIGDCYLKGLGVKKNFARAKEWMILSARQENEYGMFQLANIYEEEGDGEKYIGWLTKAAVKGLGEAQCNLGVEYVTGKYVEKDLEKALQWMEKARGNNISKADEAIKEIKGMMEEAEFEKGLQELDAQGLASRAQGYYQKNDYRHAVPYFEKAAQMGLPAAQAMIGAWYAKGIDTEGREAEPDLEKAKYWMEKAAEKGEPAAKEALSEINRARAVAIYNEGVRKIKARVIDEALGITVEDFSEAQRYLERAGELGLLEAQILLASHYLYGDCRCISQLRSAGLIESLEISSSKLNAGLGMYWVKKAAEQEDANSMFVYAKCLLWGPGNIDSHILFETGIEDGSKYENTQEAFDMAVRAANLGCLKAVGWLSKAEKNHYPGAGEALRRTKSYQEWEEEERKKKES